MEETKNKQAAEQKEWLMPDEIEIIETSDPKVMLDKWLAEPVARKWTEDFVDDSTGEIVSVERTEPLITIGTYCSPNEITSVTSNKAVGVFSNFVPSQKFSKLTDG